MDTKREFAEILDTKISKEEIEKRKIKSYNKQEFLVWLGIFVLISFSANLEWNLPGKDRSVDSFAIILYDRMIFATVLVFVPILFKLVFGYLPLTYIRIRAWRKKDDLVEQPMVQKDNEYLRECIIESKGISDRMNRNSTVYLFVGCLMAVTGLVVFLIMQPNKQEYADIMQFLLKFLPRFGILIFIESIAFYFLRQHRRMLEEYRYYEAIKRSRQRFKVFFDTIQEYKDSPELLKIVVDFFKQSDGYRMSDKEVDMRVELEKIISQEVEPSTKIAEVIKILRN